MKLTPEQIKQVEYNDRHVKNYSYYTAVRLKTEEKEYKARKARVEYIQKQAKIKALSEENNISLSNCTRKKLSSLNEEEIEREILYGFEYNKN